LKTVFLLLLQFILRFGVRLSALLRNSAPSSAAILRVIFKISFIIYYSWSLASDHSKYEG
jgi:multisubunit Na+/H+ antiporter MnhE subunit